MYRASSRHAPVNGIKYTGSMGTPTLYTDIVIIGGGVAGLWALNLLRERGYSAVLFEQEALGSHQTIGSQGMIHGGIKYALGGALTPGSQAIAAMPSLWRECLAGRGPVNLRGCEVLSDAFHVWSSGSLSARINSFFASKLLRGRVEALKPDAYPAPLRHPDFRGHVYRLEELVLDVPSLVSNLAKRHSGDMFCIDWDTASLQRVKRRARLVLPEVVLEPECLLLAAGCGNQALMEALDSASPAMQRRPLQQVLVKHSYAQPLFAHCLGNRPSPRLTITSHRCSDGHPVWYLGGDLATAGAGESPERLVDHARGELAELLPWLDLGECEWRTLTLDRAEHAQAGLMRPDTAFVGPVADVDNALVAWPTKLTLTPRLGELLESQLQERSILPRHTHDLSPLAQVPRPALAAPYWDTLFQ